MKTYYIIEKGQKLVNANGVIFAEVPEFDIWGRYASGTRERAIISRNSKAEAVKVAKEYGMVVETKIVTEEELEAIREN